MSSLLDIFELPRQHWSVHLATLKTIARAKGLNQSDLAKLAGVSRQAVSLWLRSDAVDAHGGVGVHSRHLVALSAGLGVSLDVLARPLPGLAPAERQRLSAELNWDRLFPDLDALLHAIARQDPRALARLVEKRGLFAAAKIAGRVVWSSFPSFKRFVPPRRREELERVWTSQKNLGLI